MYNEIFLDHFRNPRNVGELPPPALTVDVSNPACGDLLRLSALLAGGVLAEVRYKVRGCTASIAAGSALTEWLTGRTAAQAAKLAAKEIEDALGGLLPESKHAAELCVDGTRRLLAMYTQNSAHL